MFRRLVLLAVVALLLVSLPGTPQEPIWTPQSDIPSWGWSPLVGRGYLPQPPTWTTQEFVSPPYVYVPPTEQPVAPPVTQPSQPRWAGRAYISRVSDAESRLRSQVIQLKQDIDRDLDGTARRGLVREADDVLDALDGFQDRMQIGTPRATLYADLAEVEGRVRALAQDAQTEAVGRPALRTTARRVTGAEDRLHETVTEDNASTTWDPELVLRKAENLVLYAHSLQRQGSWSLLPGRDRRVLQGDLQALSDATEYFRGSAGAGEGRSRLIRDFRQVKDAWARVTPVLPVLTRQERMDMIPRADNVDAAVLELNRRLGLPGDLTRLDVGPEPSRPMSGIGVPLSQPAERWTAQYQPR